MQPIGYFTSCPQGQDLIRAFGDYDLKEMSQVDQAALTLVLGKVLYDVSLGYDSDIKSAASAAIPTDQDYTSVDFSAILNILEGITKEDAIGILQFLIQ